MAVLQSNPTSRPGYMFCARPVLVAIDGVPCHLACEQADAGCFAEAENASAVRKMADDSAQRARMDSGGRNRVHATAVESLVATWPEANARVADRAESAGS